MFEVFDNNAERSPRSLRQRLNLIKPTSAIQSFGESQITIADLAATVFLRVLDRQIALLADALVQSAKRSERCRNIAKERLGSIVQRTFGGSVELFEFGSNLTKLITPFSDIDLGLSHKTSKIYYPTMAVDMLQVLSENLTDLEFVVKTNPILKATVPVIKVDIDPSVPFEDSPVAGERRIVKCDIIVKIEDNLSLEHTSTRTTNYVIEASNAYSSFFSNILVLKFSLNCVDLANSYKGGLNSYGLCLLYIAYLKTNKLEKERSLGATFLGFLEFMIKFDASSYGVFLGSTSKCLISKSLYQGNDIGQLLVMDPTQFAHKNVTSTCTLLYTIVDFFKMVYDGLSGVRERAAEAVRTRTELRSAGWEKAIEEELHAAMGCGLKLEDSLLFALLQLQKFD